VIEIKMPHYISLINWTEQGLKNVKDSTKRFAMAKQAIEKTGVKIQDVYYTMGRYDMIGIIQAPDDESMAKSTLLLASQGNSHFETLKAFTFEEAAKILQSLP
jgi:uncharacterized protein with GYD domain